MSDAQRDTGGDHRRIEFTQQFDANLVYELDFLQRVDSSPHLADRDVIRNAVRRYERCWLPLIAEVSDAVAESLAPPLDVHWIWHCHMLAPYNYQADCIRIVGKVIGHSVRSIVKLEQGRQETEKIWKQRYADEAFDPGEGPIDVNHERQSEYDLDAATRRQAKFFYNVSLPHYRNKKFLAIAVDRYKKFISLRRVNSDALLVPCYDIDLVWHTHQLHPLQYKVDTVRCLGRMLNHNDSPDDQSSDSAQDTTCLYTGRLWQKFYKESFAYCWAMSRGESPRGKLLALGSQQSLAQLHVSHSPDPDSSRLMLTLKPDQFQDCIIPEHIEQLWGPVPLPRLPAGTDNKYISATHRLFDKTGELKLTCRVVHSVPLSMSAVQIFQLDKIVVVSHLIGSEQMPSSFVLDDPSTCRHVDFHRGERAMIIKDNIGEWGIAVGCWKGTGKGIPEIKPAGGQRGVQGLRGNPGHFQARFYPLRIAAGSTVLVCKVDSLPTDSGKFDFQIEDMRVDLRSGKIKFKTEIPSDVAQKTCLAVSIATLFTLCQPRPPCERTVGSVRPLQTMYVNGKSTRHIEPEFLARVLAAGWLMSTPFNSNYVATVNSRSM